MSLISRYEKYKSMQPAQCRKCNEIVEASQFRIDKRTGRTIMMCRECKNAYNRELNKRKRLTNTRSGPRQQAVAVKSWLHFWRKANDV